jgi:hypothetical protein
MSNYEGRSYISWPCENNQLKFCSPEDHGINDTNSNRDTQTASSNSANQSPYAARTAPTNYAEFAEMMQSSMHEDAGPGIMVDEDVWDQVFGGLSGRYIHQTIRFDRMNAFSSDFLRIPPRIWI